MRRVRAALAAVPLLTAPILLASCGDGDGGPVTYRAVDLATGEDTSITSLRGEPALLMSWTTWCTECDEALSGIQAFADSRQARDITVVAVNLDAGDVAGEIDAKIADHGLTTIVWRDRHNDFARAFGALGVPTTVVLGADGSVAGIFPGAVDLGAADVVDALERARGGPPS